MTRLIKLTLKNFKSFKKADIPISRGFTSIVGSNGSGKSNILDALLFVLGITSLKTLRAGKLTDLVNTDARENYGKVDLLLKDKDKSYEISRMIDKQGKSVYRLDGKRTTLNEISSLLTDLGIDVDGHNIVTQGDITRIIEMSPVERREVIDNIAGLSEFDQKKEEAIKELDKVDSRIKEAAIIMNERNSFLTELEEEMRAAKEFRELEEELRRTKATILSKELYAIEKKILSADNEISELEKQKAIIEERIAQERKNLLESKKMSDELSKKMIKASEQTYSTIGREFEEKKAKLMLEQEKIGLKLDQAKKNREKILSNTEEVEVFSEEKSALEEKCKRLEGELASIEKSLEESAKKRASLEAIVRSKNAELAKEEARLDEVEKSAEDAKKDVFELEVASRNYEKQKSFNEKKLSELLGEETALIEDISRIEKKKKQIEEELSRNPHKMLADLETKLNSALEQKNLFNSKRGHEEKAVLELKKSASQCPTCDSPLKEDKKGILLRQKEALIVEYEKNEKRHADEINEIKKLIEAEKEKIMLTGRLSAEISHEKSVLDRVGEVKNKIKAIKKELQEAKIDEILAKRDRINQAISVYGQEREKLREIIASMRKQDVFGDYSTAGSEIDKLIQKKNKLATEDNDAKSRLEGILFRCDSALKENDALQKEINKLEKEVAEKETAIEALKAGVLKKEAELLEAKKKSAVLGDEKDASDKKIDKFEKEIIAESGKLKKIEFRIGEFNIEKSKLGVREADLTEEKKAFEGIEPFASKSLEECRERTVFVEKRIAQIGNVNLKAVDNFNELKKEVEDIQQKSNKLSEERLAVLDMIDKIEVKRTSVFMDCFKEINKNFQDIFFKFFNGEGNLSFTDNEKPLDSGLLIDSKQKSGKLQNIDAMSGGEKTLTALAFMFSIQLYKPAPFYAFDEADAALDKENSFKMSNLIEKIAEKSQFIAITHNDVITKKAHQIIGVARGKDDSSVIGLKLKNASDEDLKEIKTNSESKYPDSDEIEADE